MQGPNTTWITMISIMWAFCAAGLAWYVASIARQITYVTLADGRKQERKLPLMFRLLMPLAPNFIHFFRKPFFAGAKVQAARRITAAGFDGLITDEEFLSLRVIFPLIFGPLLVLFVRASISATRSPILQNIEFLLDLLGIFWLYMYPVMWLRRTLETRHRSMRKALPFVLDLMTLSVEAGMDFMTALQRNIERRAMDPLGEELLRVIREIQIGKTRREALRDMSRRVDLMDVRTVVNAFVQADELGVSIGSVLRIQADQSRQRRFERAERLANEAPVKMLFPLLFFIFPSVFLILLGPIVTKIIQQVAM
jgi:tight adherence protein C